MTKNRGHSSVLPLLYFGIHFIIAAVIIEKFFTITTFGVIGPEMLIYILWFGLTVLLMILTHAFGEFAYEQLQKTSLVESQNNERE